MTNRAPQAHGVVHRIMQIVVDVKCVNDMHMISSPALGILIRFSASYLISLALIMKLLILNLNRKQKLLIQRTLWTNRRNL